jgi:transposase-like protein
MSKVNLSDSPDYNMKEQEVGKKKKRYTTEEKVDILGEILKNSKTVNDAAIVYGVCPSTILTWWKWLSTIVRKFPKMYRLDIAEAEKKLYKQKIPAFGEKLRKKDAVIAELVQKKIFIISEYMI